MGICNPPPIAAILRGVNDGLELSRFVQSGWLSPVSSGEAARCLVRTGTRGLTSPGLDYSSMVRPTCCRNTGPNARMYSRTAAR